MTDEWFDEYMFRLVVDKKYITDKSKRHPQTNTDPSSGLGPDVC